MGLKIYWTAFAKKELQNIFDYYKEVATLKVASKIATGIAKETLKLKNNPNIGQIEELLIEREQGFRYLIYKNYKIIYWINKDKSCVEISDVFDARQNPIKLNRNK